MLHLFVARFVVCLFVCFFVSFFAPVSASNALKKSIREGPAVTIISWIEAQLHLIQCPCKITETHNSFNAAKDTSRDYRHCRKTYCPTKTEPLGKAGLLKKLHPLLVLTTIWAISDEQPPSVRYTRGYAELPTALHTFRTDNEASRVARIFRQEDHCSLPSRPAFSVQPEG